MDVVFLGLPVEALEKAGGEDGIRTHGTVAGTRAFQARRIGHSRTSPNHFLVGFLPFRPNFQTAQAGLSLFFSKVEYFIMGPFGPQG